MSATLIGGGDCCAACPDPVVSQVPGPAGPPGGGGTNGTNGVNAYTVTTAQFTMPAVNATVSVPVAVSSWLAIGEVVFVQSAGYFSVNSVPDGTHGVLKNLGYTGNVAPTTVVATAQAVSPGGLIGVTGAAGTNATPSPTTSRGDLIADNGANNPLPSNVRLGVGVDGTRLKAASGQATGLQWSAVDLSVAAEITNALLYANGGTTGTSRTDGFNKLAPAGPVRGDIIAFDGTNWVRRPRGLVTQCLTTNVAGDAVWTDRGRVMQEVIVPISATSTTAAVIPFDDTIPQNTEGLQLFSQAFTPKDPVQSYIEVQAIINCSTLTADSIIASLFTDAGANAVCAGSSYCSTANKPHQIALLYQFAQAAGAAFTAALRIGTAGGATLHVNAIDDGAGVAVRKFGGVQLSYLRITEFSVAGF